MQIPLEKFPDQYPKAWGRWSKFAMAIPKQDFDKQDWFAVFFKIEGINYKSFDPERAFKTLEDNINILK